jgi:hypothetical protein
MSRTSRELQRNLIEPFNIHLPTMNRIKDSFTNLLYEPITLYTTIIGLSICLFIVLEAAYPRVVDWGSGAGFSWLENRFPNFATPDDRAFSLGFVEWFGVFYGFFLPLLLVRAWEQLDRADREFDREADAIKVLLEDILLLEDKDFLDFKLSMACRLHLYCRHVWKRYRFEHLPESAYLKKHGDNLIQGIRIGYKNLIYRGGGERANQLEPMTTELLERLNEAIDTRGDRISIFRQRLYESLRILAVVTSAVWLIPFYFLSFEVGIFGSLLKLGVTVLIILVLSIIDDLDQPFEGFWTVNTSTWEEVLAETGNSLYKLAEKAGPDQILKKIRGREEVIPSARAVPAKAETDSRTISQLLWAGSLSLMYLLLVPPNRNQGK